MAPPSQVDAGHAPVPDRGQDFSLVLRMGLREEDILAARSRMAELEEEAEERGFEVKVGAVGFADDRPATSGGAVASTTFAGDRARSLFGFDYWQEPFGARREIA